MHFSKKKIFFLWFSLKTHVCTMFLIKTFFIWDWKRPKNAQCVPGKGSISHLQKMYLHFSSEISCFELIFIFSPFRTYSYTTISIKKTVHNVVLKQKNKVKIACLSPVNQLLCVLLTNHLQWNCRYFHYHQFPTDQMKSNINNFFINTSQ